MKASRESPELRSQGLPGVDALLRAVRRPLIVLSPEARILAASPAAARLFHREDGELTGWAPRESSWFQNLPDREHVIAAFRQAVAGAPARWQLPTPTQDQPDCRIGVWFTPVHDGEGKVAAILVERDPAELAPTAGPATDSDRQLQLILEAGPWVMGVWDVGRDSLWLHPLTYDVFHLPQSAGGKSLAIYFDLIHPEDRAKVRADLDRALAAGRELRTEFRIDSKDGCEAWWAVCATMQRQADGRPTRLVGLGRDITQRKRAELAVQESEERFRAIFERSPAGIALGGPDGRFLHANPAFCEMLGYTAEQLRLMTGADILHPSQRHFAEEYLRKTKATGEAPPFQAERSLLRADGSAFWARISAAPLRRDGKLSGLVLVVQDVTVETQARDAIRESELRFRTMADSSPGCLWMTDTTGRAEFMNKALIQFLGTEVSGSAGVLSFIHPEDRQRVRSVFERGAEQQAPFTCEYRIRRADGVYRWVIDQGTPRFSPEGEFLGFAGSALDITDRLNAEQALREELQRRAEMEKELHALSQRLIDAQEQIRQEIARELHDDLGQRTAALGYGLFNLKRKLGNLDPEVREAFQRLEENIARLGADIRQLSHRLHPATLEHAGLKSALKALAGEFTAAGLKVSVRLECPDDGLSPEAHVSLFRFAQEALQNVARHSGVREAELDLLQEDGRIRLCISDRGAGFDPRQRHKNGFGLISMRERARLLGGTFHLESAPGLGTRITLEIGAGRPRTATPA